MTEARLHLFGERLADKEARHLILILVGHQLEQIARDGLGKAPLARGLRGFGCLRLFDQRAVAFGISRILIFGEEGGAPLHHLVERL